MGTVRPSWRRPVHRWREPSRPRRRRRRAETSDARSHASTSGSSGAIMNCIVNQVNPRTVVAHHVSTRIDRNVREPLPRRVLYVTAIDQCSMRLQNIEGVGMRRNWMSQLNNQPLPVRALIGLGCLITAATAFSTPGEADPKDENFIDALSHAGIEYGEPGNAMAVGES